MIGNMEAGTIAVGADATCDDLKAGGPSLWEQALVAISKPAGPSKRKGGTVTPPPPSLGEVLRPLRLAHPPPTPAAELPLNRYQGRFD
jgi:hypothetical protein